MPDESKKARRRYASGAAFEREVRRELEHAGWAVVRSAGSKGPADLWAAKVRPEAKPQMMLLLVQCKTDGALSVAEWKKLAALAELTGGLPVLASKVDGELAVHQLSREHFGWRKRMDTDDGDGGLRT